MIREEEVEGGGKCRGLKIDEAEEGGEKSRRKSSPRVRSLRQEISQRSGGNLEGRLDIKKAVGIKVSCVNLAEKKQKEGKEG